MMRPAMSMIELVFAIVIMGIAVMTLPLVLTQVQNNNAFALQQEAILAAKAKIGNVLTYEWDERSYDPITLYSYVLNASNGDNELNATVGTQRVGHIDTDYRRKFFPTETNASTIGSDANDAGSFDDVDDFNGISTLVAADPQTLDYVFDLNLTTSVNYVSDNTNYAASTLNGFALNPNYGGATPTNIKAISVTVSGGDQNITLRAFTCNIGESKLLPSRPY